MTDPIPRPDSIEKTIRNAARLRVAIHSQLPSAVNSFEIHSYYGCVVGGNLMVFVAYADQGALDYPTVFKSRRAANTFLAIGARNDQLVEDLIDREIRIAKERKNA